MIKVTLIAGVLCIMVLFVRSQDGVRMRASKRLAFFGFLILNVYAVLVPDHVTWVAKRLGVGRGADLLLYLLVVTFVFVVIHFYFRLKEAERRLTDLARAVAVGQGEALNRERGLLPGTPAEGRQRPDSGGGVEIDTTSGK